MMALLQLLPSPTTLWLDYAKTLLVLAAVCCAALFAVKVLLPKLPGASSTTPGLVQVFARQPLEPKKTLYLVRAGKSVILLAATGDTVASLATLDGADFPQAETPGDTAKPLLFQQISRAIAARGRDRTR